MRRVRNSQCWSKSSSNRIAKPRRPYLHGNTRDRNDRALPWVLLGYAGHKPLFELGIGLLRPVSRNPSSAVSSDCWAIGFGLDWLHGLAGHRRMRLIWLPIIALVCVGTVFLFRSRLGAHAQEYSGAIEKIQSNKEAKGDRLDLLYRPSKRQPPAPVQPLLAPQEPAAVQAISARQTPAKPESSKSAETVSWHWRAGAKTITKTSSRGEKTQLSRAKVR
jgi:hypothetical protein